MTRSVALVVLGLFIPAVGVFWLRPSAVLPEGLPGGITPFEQAKAEQLLATRLPCLGCHSMDGAGGRIGPDLSSVGKRLTREEIFRRVADPQGVQPGSLMPRVSMPGPWRELVVEYLAARGASPSRLPVANTRTEVRPAVPDVDRAATGAALYGRLCASCHGATGRGDGPNAEFLPVAPTAHADAPVLSERSDDQLFDTIHRGGYIMNRHPFMPSYGETLSPAQIRSLVAHIRTLCGCRGPAWSEDGRIEALH
jgi:mono/diheme cytochrome c family protein